MSTQINSVHSQRGEFAERGLASVTGEHLDSVVGRIRRELIVLRQEQTAISKRIAIIKRTIAGLAQVFGPGVFQGELQTLLSHPSRRASHLPLGLTELCRKSLRESPAPLTLPQILEQIREHSPAVLANHRSPRASVTVVLRRLEGYFEAEEVRNSDGLRRWRWIAPTHPASDGG